ncbi:hypothetical protein ACVW0J_001004 [Bradyrhizobium sp. i1.7.7]
MAVDVVTFGCRLNAFEAELIRREAEGAGLSDTIVINSCAVTNEAVAQARQSIRKLKRERPGARIVVTGCAAQTQSRMFADMAEVDRVLGNDDKMRSEAWRDARAAFDLGASEKIAVSDIMAVKEMAPHLIDGFASGLPRVFVQVQNGCDHRCTFCIIPYGRGNSRSVPMGAVVDQVRALVARGHAEIVLTGVDLTSYGADLPGAPRLGMLTKQILRHVPELKRLRISSIDSIEADADLLDAIGDDARLMPASAPVAAIRRRHDFEAHETAAFAQRRDRVLRPGPPPAPGHRVRSRHHRGLSDRDRGDVFALAGSRGGVRSDVPARLPVFATPRHAGRADAAGRGRCDQGACEAAACGGRSGITTAAARGSGYDARCADRERQPGPHGALSAGGDRG